MVNMLLRMRGLRGLGRAAHAPARGHQVGTAAAGGGEHRDARENENKPQQLARLRTAGDAAGVEGPSHQQSGGSPVGGGAESVGGGESRDPSQAQEAEAAGEDPQAHAP